MFEGKDVSGSDDHNIDDIAYLICRGGWPKAIGKSQKISLKQARDYYDAVVNDDISRVDGVKRDPERTKRLMR